MLVVFATVLPFLVAWGMTCFLLACAIGIWAEHLRPIDPKGSISSRAINIFYGTVHLVVAPALMLATGPIVVLMINAAGGGLIDLTGSGIALLWTIAVYFVVGDLGEYLFHRAQHAVPILWRMHSLHHSDQSVNVATTVRHFWLESTIKALSVYAIIGVLFHPSGAVLAAYSVLAMWNYMSHSNVRLSFGPCWWLLNSPQYHRIHHSTDPAHFNRNFAGLLPIFDILFGTQYKAAPQEYPRTGLSTGQRPSGLLQAILWPFHFAPG